MDFLADIGGYFRAYYFQLDRGYIYLVTNYLTAALIPFLLSAPEKRDRRNRILLAVKMLFSCTVMELLAVVEYALLGSADDTAMLGGGVLLVLFALLDQTLPPIERAGIAYAYAGSYVNIIALLISIGTISGEENQVLQAVLALATVVLLPAVAVAYRKIRWNTLEDKWFLIPIAIAGSIGYVFGCSGKWLKINIVMKLPLYILMVVFQLTVYYTTYFVNAWIQARQQDRIKQVLRSADESMLTVLKSNLEAYNKIRHDMNNHYILMKNLLERKEYDKLQAYFAEYSGLLIPPVGVISCGNDTVAVILNMEQEKAKQSKVELDVKVAVPNEMGFADIDLCSLLSNLIDNAIEYTAGCPELSERTVKVELCMVRKNLLLTVKNPVLPQDQERALTLRTTKENKALHGLGTKLVASVVSSYGGAIRYRAEDGWFTADAMLIEPPEEG